MTPWEEYQAAAARLDAVRRRAAGVVAEQAAQVDATRAELAGLRARIAQQRSRLADVAGRAGVPVPRLAPDPGEVGAASAVTMTIGGPAGSPPVPAQPAIPASRSAPGAATGVPAAVPVPAGRPSLPAAVLAALRRSRSTLDSVDATLTALDDPQARRWRGRSTGARNALVYAAFVVLAFVAPVLAFTAGSGRGASPAGAFVLGAAQICSSAVLPVIGYALAWLTIGLLFRRRAGGRPERTPVLGAAVTVAGVVALYGGYLAVVVLR